MNTVRPPARPWKQAIYLWVGIVLVPIGILIAPLPGPGGVPILAVAALLIITSSRRAASWVRLHRRRWDWMNEILLKGEGWLGGEMGRALRRTNGRRNLVIAKPPASRKERILDILLFPVHVAIILTRAVANRYGWKLPGDARKEHEGRTRASPSASRPASPDARSGRAARAGDREAKSGKSVKRTPKDPVKVGKKKTRDGTGDEVHADVAGTGCRSPPPSRAASSRSLEDGRGRSLVRRTLCLGAAGIGSRDAPRGAGAIRKALPEAEEIISYKIPAYRLPQGVVIWFAGWKRHYSLYPATDYVVSALSEELAPYEVEKGTIRFPLDARVPVTLIGRITRLRAEEVAAKSAASGKRGMRS